MYACQWHIDIPFGKQKEVLDILKRWDDAMSADPEGPKAISHRFMVGHVGVSPSHVIHEHVMESLADWELVGKQIASGRFHRFSEEIAPYIVPGSQQWIVYRIAQ